MALVKALFSEYITAIEPDTKAKRQAAKAHVIPRDFLQSDDEFGEYVIDSFLYGSYRRQTATHGIKDVDIMLITNFDTSSYTPAEVLDMLFEALVRCYGSENVLKKNRRSIQVLNPLPKEKTDLTLDILPAVEVNDGTGYLLVPDKDEGEWILTNPRGHIKRTSEENTNEDKKLVPFIKMLKAWWHFQSEELVTQATPKPRPKSFWLETLALTYFYNLDDTWAERFLRFIRTVKDMAPIGSAKIFLEDPGMPGVELKTSMSQLEFEQFMEKVRSTEILATQAFEETDTVRSSELWAQIFGEDFPIQDEQANAELSLHDQYQLGDTSHAKELILPVSIMGSVKIRAQLYRKNYDNKRLKKLVGNLPNNGSVRSDMHIKYRAVPEFKLPKPYDVHWRVVNTGIHADSEDALRGAPFTDHTGVELERWESTKYTGKHWVDCYIVQNDKIIAISEKFYINITNPRWIS